MSNGAPAFLLFIAFLSLFPYPLRPFTNFSDQYLIYIIFISSPSWLAAPYMKIQFVMVIYSGYLRFSNREPAPFPMIQIPQWGSIPHHMSNLFNCGISRTLVWEFPQYLILDLFIASLQVPLFFLSNKFNYHQW